MGKFDGYSMMGGSNGSAMGRSSYGSIMGDLNAPRWMSGGSLPSSMMGTSRDAGEVMGRLFADSPGPRVSPSSIARLGGRTPPGAMVNVAFNNVTFSGSSVHLAIVASPSGRADDKFRLAGLINPTVTVRSGSRVTIEIINADTDTSHGFVITNGRANSTRMPMMTTNTAFKGSALWFLGIPTSAGMHAGTISFIASKPGTYQYLCPVPGHAQKGMIGTFRVEA